MFHNILLRKTSLAQPLKNIPVAQTRTLAMLANNKTRSTIYNTPNSKTKLTISGAPNSVLFRGFGNPAYEGLVEHFAEPAFKIIVGASVVGVGSLAFLSVSTLWGIAKFLKFAWDADHDLPNPLKTLWNKKNISPEEQNRLISTVLLFDPDFNTKKFASETEAAEFVLKLCETTDKDVKSLKLSCELDNKKNLGSTP